MSSQSSSDMVPRSVRKPGLLPEGKFIVGRIVEKSSRSSGTYHCGTGSFGPNASQTAGTGTRAAPSQTGKAASKGKKGKGKKGKSAGAHSDVVLEFYLCGGTSCNDVILVEAWDADVRARLEPLASQGSCVRIGKCLVVAHSDKTKWFSTSRAPVYLKALPATTMVETADVPSYPAYHPVTPLSSIVKLDPKTMMCVVGRVVKIAPVRHVSSADGDGEVAVSDVMLRAHDDVIKVSFWRETAHLPERTPCLREGLLVMVSAVAKQLPGKHMDLRSNAGLRAVGRTAFHECPAALRDGLESTPSSVDGARMWTPDGAQRKDYSTAKSDWTTLSVLDALLKTVHVRDLQKVFQVPSVHMELEDAPIYMACAKCFKAWADVEWPPCYCWSAHCPAEARKPRWRAKLILRDGTASLKATCFDAFQSVVDVAAVESGTDFATAEQWGDEAVVAKCMSYVGAVPLTVRLSVDADPWSERMQATVHLVQKTYEPGSDQTQISVSHPMKNSVRLASTEGSCPPCELADSSYDEALGLTVIDGVALQCFRGLVKVCDPPPESESDEVSRDICCAFDASKKFEMLARDDDGQMRLRAIDQDAYVHAVLSWESEGKLSAAAFIVIAGRAEGFKQFFKREVELQKAAVAEGPSFVSAIDSTPRGIVSAAEQANFTSPPDWKERTTVAE